MITKEKLIKAAKELNKAGMSTEVDVGKDVELGDLKEKYMTSVEEVIDAGKDGDLPDNVKDVYNLLVEEFENSVGKELEEEKLSKKPTPSKPVKEEKKAAAKKPEKKPEKKTAAPKHKAIEKKKPTKEKIELDDFGYRKNSKISEGLAMFRTGKYTMKEVPEKLGLKFHFYKILKAVKEAGHKVEKTKDGKTKITPTRS